MVRAIERLGTNKKRDPSPKWSRLKSRLFITTTSQEGL